MEPTFNSSRLVIARTRRGFFQNELAAECKVAPHTIMWWESGTQTPSDENISRIADATGFPRAFFFVGDIEPLPEDAVSFRARSKIMARQKHSALAAGAMARELAAWIERRFELPAMTLPDLSAPEIRKQPDLVARLIRNEWLLGNKPVPNMIHLLESRGVLVFSLARDVNDLDAFSFWSNGRPIVMLNTMKSAERSRMDAAHELLHLLCHREKTDRREERDADEFAGAFLMPSSDVSARCAGVPDLASLLVLKHRWGIALSALVFRLHELKRMSDWNYRMLFIEMSRRGFLKKEPNPIPQRETSAILAKVFESLGRGGTRPSTLAQELSWDRSHLNELIFQLSGMMLPVEGKGQGKGHSTRRTSQKARRLRLVDAKRASGD